MTSPLQEETETSKIVDLVSEVIDGELDVVGATTEVDIDNDGEPDYQYEYVYYYYDENGVNGTLIDVKPANSLTKFQNISAINIHTNSGKLDLYCDKHVFNVHVHLYFLISQQATHQQSTLELQMRARTLRRLMIRTGSMADRECQYLGFPFQQFR